MSRKNKITIAKANKEIARGLKLTEPAKALFKVMGDQGMLQEECKCYHSYQFNTFIFDAEDIKDLAAAVDDKTITHLAIILAAHYDQGVLPGSGRKYAQGSPTVILAGAKQNHPDRKKTDRT